MKRSFVYRNVLVYSFFMRMLYGAYYKERFEAIGREIPDGLHVLDVCCGDCMLYRTCLKGRVSYTGVDINEKFVTAAGEKDITALVLDIRKDPLPKADVVIMQASLYQFVPYCGEIVDKLFESAFQRVIIAEPVRNLATAGIPIISTVAKYTTDPGTGQATHRFNKDTFEDFIRGRYGGHVTRIESIAGGRECLAVLSVSA